MMIMDFKAYLYVHPTEGKDFDLKILAAGPGQTLEMAVPR